MEATVRYRRNRLLEVILIGIAIASFCVAGYAVSHGNLAYANFNGKEGNPRVILNNSTVISTVTVNHNYTTTIHGSNTTLTATDYVTKVSVSNETVYVTATKTDYSSTTLIVFVPNATTLTTTVTATVNVTVTDNSTRSHH